MRLPRPCIKKKTRGKSASGTSQLQQHPITSTIQMIVHLATERVAAAKKECWCTIAETTKTIASAAKPPRYHESSNAIPRTAELRLIAAHSTAATRRYASAERYASRARERCHTLATPSAASITERTALP